MEVDNYWETKANELDKQDTKNKEIIADLLKANKKLIQANDELKEANLRLLHRLERNFWKRFINKEDKIRRQTNAIK